MDKPKTSSMSFALLIFIAVFGITNIPNNYSVIGAQSIIWFLLLGFYLVPMGLIISELASVNNQDTSGISSWVELGLGKKLAFACGWAYFIENIFYLPMLASRVPVFLSYIFAPISSLNEITSGQQVSGIISASNNKALFLILALITVVIAMYLSLHFEKIFSKGSTIIGTISLIIAFGFIILAISTIFIPNYISAYPLTASTLKPSFSPEIFATLAWIIFAIGGIETIGTVINEVDNPNKRLPKIIIIASILIISAYAIGIVGLTFIMTPENANIQGLESTIPIMFANLFLAYGLTGTWGVILLKIVMIMQVVITIFALVLWFVTSIHALFLIKEKNIFPAIIEKRDKYGKPVNAMIFTTILIIIFLLMSSFTSQVYDVLYDMSTASVVLPFILLISSYIKFKGKNQSGGYVFIKNKSLAGIVGWILLIITFIAFIFAVVDIVSFANGDIVTGIKNTIIYLGGITFFMGIGLYFYKTRTKRGNNGNE